MTLSIREPGSAITHFIGMVLALLAGFPLLTKASYYSSDCMAAMFIFIFSMILLYAASTVYHSVNLSDKIIKVFRKIDHMMIFVLIAGSYTPVCILVLDRKTGYSLLTAVWTLAIAGIVVKGLWITCPKWFSSMIYIAMGWLCIFVFGPIVNNIPPAAFYWLLAGGVIYTAGGIIYALKLPIFNARHSAFGSHEIFHLFVMGGSFCHFIFMYQYVIGL
ncbi:MAG: hemolysin III family protein [Lachnospiraceae bacterium]|nr:hemolysin III family protein [Lachnospiraceae bacterium]